MANTVSVLNARNFIRQGGVFGNYTATSYELQGERVVLIAVCNLCGAKNRIPWSHVTAEQRTPGTLLCINRERHPALAKPAASNWQSMNDAEFRVYVKRLPSDQYLALSKNAAFAARDSEMPNMYIGVKEAWDRQEAADREAKLAPHRAMYINAFHAAEEHNHRLPCHSVSQWLALPEEQREGIIKVYDLRNRDYTPNLEKLFGKSK